MAATMTCSGRTKAIGVHSTRIVAWLSMVACLGGIGSVLVPVARAHSKPPAGLRDTEDCGLPRSQGRHFVNQRDVEIECYSFFQPGPIFAVGMVTADDLAALGEEIARLKKNPCYEVCIREMATAETLRAAIRDCNLVYIVAHAKAQEPYVILGGRSTVQLEEWPEEIGEHTSVWIGGCQGRAIVHALNDLDDPRFSTLPGEAFDEDGSCMKDAMIQGLIQELRKLQAEDCQRPIKVCLLAGVQELLPANEASHGDDDED